MSKKIVVYSQPGCPPCSEAKKFLEQQNVPFEVKDLSQDPSAVDELVKLGSQSTPTITVDDKVMVGFRKEELRQWLQEA